MHAAAAAIGQRHEVARRLGLRKRPQAFSLLAKRDVLQLVGRQDEEHAAVRASLVQLPRRMQVARPHFQAGYHAALVGHAVANRLKRLASALAGERQKRIQREEIPRLDAAQKRPERAVHVRAVLEARGQTHLHLAHVHLAKEVLHEVGRGLAVAQDVEHRGLRRRHIGLVERAHAHEVAAHGDGVLPHHEVLGKLHDRIDLEVRPRDGGIDVGQAHLEVAALVPQVVLRLVHDDAAISRIFREQQRIHLDVRQDALAVLTQAFGHELLDPQTQHAAALLREERELVAALQVVVVQKRGQADGRVVDGVLAALALGVHRMLHELVQIDAHKRSRQQAEHRQRGEPPAHGRLAGEHRAPTLFASLTFQVGAGIGDGHQMLDQLLGRDAVGHGVAHGAQGQTRLDGAAAFRGDDEKRGLGLHLGKDGAHAHRRVGVERLERDLRRIGLVVLRDGHRRLGGAALPYEHDGFQPLLDDGIGECLDLLKRIRRIAGEIRPSHVLLGARTRLVREIVQARISAMETAGDALFHERLGGRVQFFHITRQHGHLLSA